MKTTSLVPILFTSIVGTFLLYGIGCSDLPPVPTYREKIELLLPTNGEVIDTTAPMFQFASVEDVYRYDLIINESTYLEDVTPEFQLDPPLSNDAVDFQWYILGYGYTANLKSDLFTFSLADTINPTLSITSPVAAVSTDTSVTIEGTAQDNHEIASINYSINDGEWVDVGNISPFSIIFDINGRKIGDYVISIQAIDSSGNASTTASVSITTTVFRDTFPPEKSLSDVWKVQKPILDGGTASTGSGTLSIDNGKGSFWLVPPTGTIVYCDLPAGNFEAEIKFNGITTANYTAIAGLFSDAASGSSNFLIVQSDQDTDQRWGLLFRYTNSATSLPETKWDNAATEATLSTNFFIKIELKSNIYKVFYKTEESASYSIFRGMYNSLPTGPNTSYTHLALVSGGGYANTTVIVEEVTITPLP